MNYFLDVQFGSGMTKPFFGKPKKIIEFISIAIVSEDGRTYSAVHNGYDYKALNQESKDNIIKPLYLHAHELFESNFSGISHESDFHKDYGKSIGQIAKEITEFVAEKEDKYCTLKEGVSSVDKIVSRPIFYESINGWATLNQLFLQPGNFMPFGMPFFSYNIMQLLDGMIASLIKAATKKHIHSTPPTYNQCMDAVRRNPDFPRIKAGDIVGAARCNQTLLKMIQATK